MPDPDAFVAHDPAGTHECPANDCTATVPNEKAFCRLHWYAVPKQMRDAIWRSYRAGNAGTVGHIELINAAAETIDRTPRPPDSDTWRGHPIADDTRIGDWRYPDGKPVKKCPDRACGHCGQANTPAGHDACIADLPGVRNACCGHGRTIDAYIVFADGQILRREAAVGYFALVQRVRRIRAALEEIVCTVPPDDGVVLLSNDGPTHWDKAHQCHVYEHEHFSPLGDALMALWRMTDPES